jgi:putative transferase (TIGR04331 family)
MSWNYPTLMFWNPEHWETRESPQPYFKLLEEAGIFHPTPESAAKKLYEIWDDVSGWWSSNNVQHARKTFCDKYAATPPDMMKQLERVIRGKRDKTTT